MRETIVFVIVCGNRISFIVFGEVFFFVHGAIDLYFQEISMFRWEENGDCVNDLFVSVRLFD